jgi:hypothetical protein
MKKFILGGVAAIVIAVLAAVNLSLSSQDNNLLSDLALANVEALGSEIGDACGGCSTSCYKTYCCTLIINGTGFALNRCS